MKLNSPSKSSRQKAKRSETAPRLRQREPGFLPQFIRIYFVKLQSLQSKLAKTKEGTIAARALLLRISRITTKLKSQGYNPESRSHSGKALIARVGRNFATSKYPKREMLQNADRSRDWADITTVPVEGHSQDRSKPAMNKLTARDRALQRGKLIAGQDLHLSGGAYDLDKVCQVLHGASKETIDHRIRDGSLLAVPGPGDTLQFPVVQFLADGSVVSGLKAVQEALPTKNRSVILNFLIQPDQRLGDRKPIDLLKSGEIDIVVEAARRVGEQGA